MPFSLRSLTLLALAVGISAAEATPSIKPPAATKPGVKPPTTATAAATSAQSAIRPAVSDPNLSMSIGGMLQGRAEITRARNNNGQPYDVAAGGANTNKSDQADFYLRRVRLFARGNWAGTKFGVTLAADNADRAKATSTQDNPTSRNIQLFTASISREFKSGNLSHQVKGGLDYPWYNTAASASSSAALLPGNRATDQLMGSQRGVGLGYRLVAPYVSVGVDVQNNAQDDNVNGRANSDKEGLFYSTRFEFTPEGSWAIKPDQFRESYAGTPGTGVVMALEFGHNHHDMVDNLGPNTSTYINTVGFGFETLVHYNELSALMEYRFQKDKAVGNVTGDTVGTGAASASRDIFLVQAGYAFACPLVSGAVLEPVGRLTLIDLDRSEAAIENGPFGGKDYATSSGHQYEIGANWYLSGAGVYSNKVSLLYLHWRGEDQGGDLTTDNDKANAHILRAQYQLLF